MEKDFTKWETIKGDVLLIKDMETSHIKNCIRMLKEKTIPYNEEVVESIASSGVYGYAYALMEAEEIIDRSKKYIEVFNEELKRRGV